MSAAHVVTISKKALDLGFLYIPAEVAQDAFPEEEENTTIRVYFDETDNVENRLTYSPLRRRVYGLTAWYKDHEARADDAVAIENLKYRKFRFAFQTGNGRRMANGRTRLRPPYLTGEPVHFKSIAYAPQNEAGVILLWAEMRKELGMDYVTSLGPSYIVNGPDAVVKMPAGKGWVDKLVEFEFKSRNAKGKHNFDFIDYIVCWEHNWPDCPVEVIELKSRLDDLRATEPSE
jgi:hypothetical protein